MEPYGKVLCTSHPNRSLKVIVCIGNKGDDDMSIKKATNGLKAISNGDDNSKMTNMLGQLLHEYIASDNKKFWVAAKAIARCCDLEYYLGNIPHDVETLINHIAHRVESEAKGYYIRISEELGFIPMNVRQRKILDFDDAWEAEHAQAIYLARTQGNSIRNKLRGLFNTGVWDGQGGKSLTGLFSKHEYYHMDGCYSEDDY